MRNFYLNDGDGCMSCLMILLLLCCVNYIVGSYISIES